MKFDTAILMLSLVASVLSEPVTIHAISTTETETKVGNCLFVNQKAICSDPRMSRFKNSQESITIDNMKPITIGIKLSDDCFPFNTHYYQLKFVWSVLAHDANIRNVWFRGNEERGCFWDKPGEYPSYESGSILQDAQGHNMCYEELLTYHNPTNEWEDTNHIGKPIDQTENSCGSGSNSRHNAGQSVSSTLNEVPILQDTTDNIAPGPPQEVEPNSEESVQQPMTSPSETEKDSFLEDNQQENSILSTRGNAKRHLRSKLRRRGKLER